MGFEASGTRVAGKTGTLGFDLLGTRGRGKGANWVREVGYKWGGITDHWEL